MTRASDRFPHLALYPLIVLGLLAALACGGSGGPAVSRPALSASNLSSGRAGQSLLLTGSNLGVVSNVLFGSIPAASFSPSPDGTQLPVKIPTGTGTVTLSLVSPAGTVTGPTFTFVAAPAPDTGFTPATGGPGTRVVLTGSLFATTDQLVFGTTAAAGQVSADGSTLEAWVPDLAAGPVAVSVQTSDAGSIPLGQFTVLAARTTILSGAFVEVPAAGLVPDYTGREFDYPQVARTAQYGLSFPQAPILHPYNPDLAGGDVRPGQVAPRMTLNIQFPDVFREVLPDPVLQQLQASGASLDNVSVFCESQNFTWDGSQPYELRPQYWTDPDAPFIGAYNVTTNLNAGLFLTPEGVALSQAFGPAATSVHDIGAAPGPGFAPYTVVSSPDNLQVSGLAPADSTAFWSLVLDGDGNAAATLHLLLNDSDQAGLEGIMDQPAPITLGQLAQALAANPPSNAQLEDMLSALFGPVVTGAQLGTPAPGGSATLTLHGSGFTGATGVTAGTAGQAAGNLEVVSDSVLTLILPAATAQQGNIVVTTPFGSSAPAALD